MSAQPHPPLTPEQYLEIERAAEFRSEYYNGHMYAMSGGSLPHGKIIGNLTREIGTALLGTPCSVIPNDMRVQVAPNGLSTYPDLVVTCGESHVADGRNDTLLNPTVLIEVLSPSTEAYDRGFKSAQYRTIESLREYAFVSQIEPRVEIYSRQPGGTWLFTEWIGLDAACRFESLDCQISLSGIYNNVNLASGRNTPQDHTAP